MIHSASNFNGLGIAPRLLEILHKKGFIAPSPIQQQSIPAAIEGKDIIGIAQTGTGKTLAFGIPMLQRLAAHGGRGLILLPTRELALQVEASLQAIGRPFGLKTVVLIGGAPYERQIRLLKNRPHIIIGTPGRINDHLEQKTLRLDAVSVLILDEADRMLDMGFLPQITTILDRVPEKRQVMLFSATMPGNIVSLAARYMQLPIRIEVAPTGTTARDISQEIIFVDQPGKTGALEQALKDYRGSVLVFTRTKQAAKRIARLVGTLGHSAAEIHSNRTLAQRRTALEGFRRGTYRVLVATDIAARGIDVKGIELVINYDLPERAEDYVHRIGRTGRAGSTGHAISFAMPHQRGGVREIERLIKMTLPIRGGRAAHFPPETARLAESRQRFNRRSSSRPSASGGRGNFRGSRTFPARSRPSAGRPAGKR